MPSVSVIIPIHNVAPWIRATLSSVMAQTWADFECIVVDDGSTDATVETVTQMTAADPRFRLLRQANAGVCAARNRGLDEAAGEYVALLDGDDLWAQDCLERMVTSLQQAQGAVLAYCRYVMFMDGTCARKPQVWKNMQATGNIWWDMLLDAEFCMGAWLARREAVEAVGRFNPDLAIAEDRDFILRLLARVCAEHPERAVFVARDLLYYRQRPGSGVRNAGAALATEWEVMRPHLDHPGVPERVRSRGYSFLAFKMAVIAAFGQRDLATALRWYVRAVQLDPLHANLYILPLRKLWLAVIRHVLPPVRLP